MSGALAVVVRRARGDGGPALRFSETFVIGRGEECDVQVKAPGVAERHVEIASVDGRWWVCDLGSPSGTWVDGARVKVAALQNEARVSLGKDGAVLHLALELAELAEPGEEDGAARPDGSSPLGRDLSPVHLELLRHIDGTDGEPAGEQTMMLRTLLSHAQRRSARPYRLAVVLLLCALAGAGGGFVWQAKKLAALRATAESLYYASRELDLQTERIEELVGPGVDPAVVAEVARRRARLGQMEAEYEAFVTELGVYAKHPEDERVMLRVARQFGECDVNVPAEFLVEVRRYVKRWSASTRLARGLQRARDKGYASVIGEALAARGLPRHYLFLALQESDFDARAIGPPTPYGHAKGMWQFIAPTGTRYGLRLGPKSDEGVFDAEDERFNWRKATGAAARYLRDLSNTEAQGSGLLALASYNWGEGNVRQLIASMPENPRERNFWRMLKDRRVPAETYDYVLSIFSAAVICEKPSLFEMSLACPDSLSLASPAKGAERP